jgi:ketosteroid isomerase-like protein
MPEYEKAMRPEDVTRLFVERSNAGDATGVAALYGEDAVMAYPSGSQTGGRRRSARCGAKCSPTVPASRRNNRCRR